VAVWEFEFPGNGGTMGAKSRHPSPLSEVDKHAVAELFSEITTREGWTPTVAYRLLGTACERLSSNDKIQFAEFDPDLKTIKKLMETREPINDWHMWGFFLWFQNDYGKELLQKQIGEQLKRKEQGVKSLRLMLGHWEPVQAGRMQSLQGSYKLYRPSHVSPTEKIIISQLDIGKEDNHFFCSLSSKFNDSYNKPREDFFRGHIIPHGNKLMAIMFDSVTNYEEPGFRYPGIGVDGNIILHFDDVDYSANDEAVQGLSGIVLMAVGSGPASAWPILARRLAEGEVFEPSELDAADFPSLPRPIQQSLSRGAVHWDHSYYQSPFTAPRI
jgi:hypothetical protein